MAQEAYAHQLDAFRRLVDNPRYALFHDCGVGKTLPTIMAMDYRRQTGQIDNVLVICPKVAVYNWVKELKDNAEFFRGLYVVEGTGEKRRKILASVEQEGSVVIAGYDILRLHSEFETLAQSCKLMLVLDESHCIKNGQAQRSKAAHRLADAVKYVVLLTGTPIGKDIGDVWSQYRALDGGETFGNSWWRFRNYWMKKVPYVRGMWVPKHGAVQAIKDLMWTKAHLLKRSDCLSLPETTYTTVPVVMPPGMRRIYVDMAEALAAEFQSDNGKLTRVQAANLAAATMKLQQITSGFAIDMYKETEELKWQPKLDALVELAESICTNHKLVVWCRFRRDLAKCKAVLHEWQPLSIESEHNSEDRNEACQLFNEDNEHRIIVSNPQAGGVAINLVGGSYAVYYSNSYDWIHRKQSEDRLHRIGQRWPVQYIDLIMEETVDQTVKEVLDRKQSLVDYIEGRGDIRSILYGGEHDGNRRLGGKQRIAGAWS